MNILEINRNALASLYEQFPESFTGLRLEGEYLVYGSESCNISEFNIYDLINGSNSFSANLDTLTAEDIFKIIRLHSLSVISNEKNEEKLIVIKQENPLLKNVTIIPRNEKTGKEEIINIVDSNGKDNMFINTYRIDFFDTYEAVKAKVGGKEVTPEDLIEELNRRIYLVSLENSRDVEERLDASKDYENKMENVSSNYSDSNSIKVYGNEDLDVALVSDSRSNDDHQVVVFDKNEFGDTVASYHQQDIQGQDTVTTSNNTSTVETEKKETEEKEEETIQLDDDINEDVITLISSDEFYELLESSIELSGKQKDEVETYYAFLGDLMLYEEYLLPELMNVLNNFRAYILDLTVKKDQAEIITVNQEQAIDKSVELEEKTMQLRDKVINPEMNFQNTQELAYQRTLKLERKYKNAQQGFVSTIAILAAILIVVIILTIITLSLV